MNGKKKVYGKFSKIIESKPPSPPTNEHTQSTMELDFEEDIVTICLQPTYSKVNERITPDYFSEVEVEAVQDYYFESLHLYFNNPNFVRILRLTLTPKSKEYVLWAISELEKRDDVLAAEPQYIQFSDPCFDTW